MRSHASKELAESRLTGVMSGFVISHRVISFAKDLQETVGLAGRGFGGARRGVPYGTPPNGRQASSPEFGMLVVASFQDSFSLDGPIDGGSSHTEQVSQFGGGVLTRLQ